MTAPLLGVIADDFTGATDAANMLARVGLSAAVLIGVPALDAELVSHADALVVALKSRTVPVAGAVTDSLAALAWLRTQGCGQFYFKYCSTFDSTPHGNIGPVADALLDALGETFTVVCPALPVNGRTVYGGHLFVGGQLLSDSPMRDHPLTPMTDANLLRVLAQQTSRRVGLADAAGVERGEEALRGQLARLRAEGVGYAVVDATNDAHLRTLARAASHLKLLTGGSGLAGALGEDYRMGGQLAPVSGTAPRHVISRALILSGSCSAATRAQVAQFAAQHPAFTIDPLALSRDPAGTLAQIVDWLKQDWGGQSLLVSSSAPSDQVKEVQRLLGTERAASLIEELLSDLAVASGDLDFNTLVVAGGETSGAVVGALGVQALEVGPEIDPGVPWTLALPERRLALALKSGNFGTPDFFEKALRVWA
ncbi:Four-carbon acid sugar kinase family protein [Deinococcus saxicola]|uniref:3-oxo-tetronate kinase n=1 Tax=Deinococcus saxicola TaxID=249406 RepID=UPI0039F0A2CE